MTEQSIENLAKARIVKYTNSKQSDSNNHVTVDDVFTVWKAKTIQNWKYIMGTTAPDNLLFEVTYNGDRDEIYVDCYKQEFKYIITSNSSDEYDV